MGPTRSPVPSLSGCGDRGHTLRATRGFESDRGGLLSREMNIANVDVAFPIPLGTFVLPLVHVRTSRVP